MLVRKCGGAHADGPSQSAKADFAVSGATLVAGPVFVDPAALLAASRSDSHPCCAPLLMQGTHDAITHEPGHRASGVGDLRSCAVDLSSQTGTTAERL